MFTLPCAQGHAYNCTWIPIDEINNKQADTGQGYVMDGSPLLPNTTVSFEFADSRGSRAGVLKSINFVEHAFGNDGVDALIGAGSSTRSETAHTVLNVFDVPPMVSYAATSPVLSDADLFPNFFRTVASDTFLATAVVEF